MKGNIHYLKIEAQYFEAALDNSKLFEIRENDRGFQRGDAVILEEIIVNRDNPYDEKNKKTGRQIGGVITYVTNYLQQSSIVVFGYAKVSVESLLGVTNAHDQSGVSSPKADTGKDASVKSAVGRIKSRNETTCRPPAKKRPRPQH